MRRLHSRSPWLRLEGEPLRGSPSEIAKRFRWSRPHRLQSSKKIKPDGKMLVFTAGLVELCINRYLLFLVAGLSPAPHRSPRGILFASAQKESKMRCRLFLNKFHKIRHCLLKVYTIPLKLAVFHCKSDALSCVLSRNLHCLFPIVTIHKSANTCA